MDESAKWIQMQILFECVKHILTLAVPKTIGSIVLR